MQKIETLSYEEQFKNVVVSFSPFVLNSTGIIQSQTSLKVDTFTAIVRAAEVAAAAAEQR